ncbi:insulinase family protein [SAR202 cluster bacterium AD-804-J14_MRT_500m]|nr:insulinase family protein [SAR202 cluster bacterium AD-804-J14_MRT_500m]
MHQSAVLGNGLRIVTSKMPQTFSVTVAVLVGSGSRYETDEIAGATHFLEHLLFKGTESMPTAKQISAAIEGVGGVMNASTDRELTVYWCKVARSHFKTALSVLIDMVKNPLLDPEEMEKERHIIFEELRMSADYPSNRVDLLIDEMLWPDQPMGRDIGGSKESVGRIKREDLLDLMEKQYTPSNVVISVAGDVDHDEVIDLLDISTVGWESKEAGTWNPVILNQNEPAIRVEYKKSEQVHLCVGLPGLQLNHPDTYAANLVNVMLGEGMSSRLFQEIRENQALAYDVHSYLGQFRDCGSLIVYCGTEPSRSALALDAIMGQLKTLAEGFSEDELEMAREYAKGSLMLRMEDSRTVAMWQGGQEMLVGQVNTVEHVLSSLDLVTLQDVNRVACDFIKPDQLNVAIVGPFRSHRRFQRSLRF